jgi:hypothetical protein
MAELKTTMEKTTVDTKAIYPSTNSNTTANAKTFVVSTGNSNSNSNEKFFNFKRTLFALILLATYAIVFAEAGYSYTTAEFTNTSNQSNNFALYVAGQIDASFNCGADAKICSDINNFCFETCGVQNSRILVSNSSSEKKCYSFSAIPSRRGMNFSLANPEFCLNPFESVVMPFWLDTCTMDSTSVTFQIKDSNAVLSKELKFVKQSNCSTFGETSIKTENVQVCKNETRKTVVTLRQSSSFSSSSSSSSSSSGANKRELNLWTSSNYLNAYFQDLPSFIEPNFDYEATLVIDALNASEGINPLKISVVTNGKLSEKTINVDVINCPSENGNVATSSKRTFDINAPTQCYSGIKGTTVYSYFKVRSINTVYCNPSKKRQISFSTTDSDSIIGFSSIALGCGEEKIIPVETIIPLNATPENKFIYITAIDSTDADAYYSTGGINLNNSNLNSTQLFSTEGKICVNILPASNIQLSSNGPLTAQKNVSVPFEITIFNNGDRNETLIFGSSYKSSGLRVTFSPSTKLVKAKSSEKIIANVFAEAYSDEGAFFVVDANSAFSQASIKINFNAYGTPTLNAVQVLSSSKKLELGANNSIEYYAILRNNSTSNKQIEMKISGIGISNQASAVSTNSSSANSNAVNSTKLFSQKTSSVQLQPEQIILIKSNLVSTDFNGPNFNANLSIIVDGVEQKVPVEIIFNSKKSLVDLNKLAVDANKANVDANKVNADVNKSSVDANNSKDINSNVASGFDLNAENLVQGLFAFSSVATPETWVVIIIGLVLVIAIVAIFGVIITSKDEE